MFWNGDGKYMVLGVSLVSGHQGNDKVTTENLHIFAIRILA